MDFSISQENKLLATWIKVLCDILVYVTQKNTIKQNRRATKFSCRGQNSSWNETSALSNELFWRAGSLESKVYARSEYINSGIRRYKSLYCYELLVGTISSLIY